MASGANPILSGIFRALQLRSMLEGQRRAEQREKRLQDEHAEEKRRKAAEDQRNQAIEMVKAEEKAYTLGQKLQASGGFRVRPENFERFEDALSGGDDFSVQMAPGIATTASAGELRSFGQDRWFVPDQPTAERAKSETGLEQKLAEDEAVGAQNTAQALARMRQEAALKQELAPVDTIGGLTEDESGNLFAVERDPRTRELTPRQVPGLKKRPEGAVTPRQLEIDARAKRNEERSILKDESTDAKQRRSEAKALRRDADKLDLEIQDTEHLLKGLYAELQKKAGRDPAITGDERAEVERDYQAMYAKFKKLRAMKGSLEAELAELEPQGKPKLRGSSGSKKSAKDPLGIR